MSDCIIVVSMEFIYAEPVSKNLLPTYLLEIPWKKLKPLWASLPMSLKSKTDEIPVIVGNICNMNRV